MVNVIQNAGIPAIKDKVAEKATNEIFAEVIGLNYFKDLADDLTTNCVTELRNASFMTVDLELSEEQKSKLSGAMPQMVSHAVNSYISKIKKDERTKKTVEIVESKVKQVIERALSAIAAEINRGALINSVAVSADSKNDEYNKIELRHSKNSGDITIPTRGIFISTNCIENIRASVVVTPPVNDDEKVDPKTGEIIENKAAA